MNERRFRLLLIWNAVLTLLLLVSLAGNAMWVQASNDPPVQVASAQLDDVGGGFGTNTSTVVVDSSAYTKISTAKLTMSGGHTHICLATASAFTNGAAASYHDFAIALDNPQQPVVASRRQVYTAGALTNEVTTIQAFTNLTGYHEFHLVARGTPAASVFNRGLIVVCLKKQM